MSYFEEVKRTKEAKKNAKQKVYIVYDYEGDLVADNVVGKARAKKLADEVFGTYEEQY